MKTNLPTKILLAVGVIVLLWHLQVATSAKTRVAGPFLAKPAKPGYVWDDIPTNAARFFWDLSGIKWKAGVDHPDFNAESAEKEGSWNPRPGYSFVNKSIDLTTVWEAGLLHPDFMAWSDKNEGAWIPVAGYKFIYTDGEISGAEWDPNKRYDDLKISSLAEKDGYKPFPGYQFIEPGKSLKVVWTPGMVNYENGRLVAGAQEGSWTINNGGVRYASGSSSGTGYIKNRIVRRMVNRAADRGVDRAVDRVFGY